MYTCESNLRPWAILKLNHFCLLSWIGIKMVVRKMIIHWLSLWVTWGLIRVFKEGMRQKKNQMKSFELRKNKYFIFYLIFFSTIEIRTHNYKSVNKFSPNSIWNHHEHFSISFIILTWIKFQIKITISYSAYMKAHNHVPFLTQLSHLLHSSFVKKY